MSKGKIKVLLDVDPLIYEAGFAAQRSHWEVICVDPDDNTHVKYWDDGNEKNKFFRENKDWTLLEQEKHTELQPVTHAIQIIKTTLETVLKESAQHFKVQKEDIVMPIIMQGGNNFRMKIAKQRAYKGNRPPKPEHYEAIRKYLADYRHAFETEGNETDDEVSIQARFTDSVVASIDKDLDQIPGVHYNTKKKVFYEVSEFEGMTFFYEQAISGDSTDSIPGAYRIGVAKAKKIINEAVKEITQLDWEKPDDRVAYEAILWGKVLRAYYSPLSNPKCPYTVREVPGVALETARLVKMQEYDGQLWNPPGTPDGNTGDLVSVEEEPAPEEPQAPVEDLPEVHEPAPEEVKLAEAPVEVPEETSPKFRSKLTLTTGMCHCASLDEAVDKEIGQLPKKGQQVWVLVSIGEAVVWIIGEYDHELGGWEPTKRASEFQVLKTMEDQGWTVHEWRAIERPV